jgi:hypothetical protein
MIAALGRETDSRRGQPAFKCDKSIAGDSFTRSITA